MNIVQMNNVRYGGFMKKLSITKEELIDLGIEIAKKDGLGEITIRNFAKNAGVSVGTVYLYFENKDNLLSEIIEGFWNDTINNNIENIINHSENFIISLDEIYSLLYKRSSEFHKFLIRDMMKMGSSSCSMDFHLNELKNKLCKLTEKYPDIYKKISRVSSIEDFLNYLVDNIFSSLRRKDNHLLFVRESLIILFDLDV